MNSVQLIGRSGASAELKYLPSGTAVCELSLAVSEKRGVTYETHWIRVKLFGKTAEMAAPGIAKGDELFVSGKLSCRQWQDSKTGQRREAVEVIAFTVRGTRRLSQPAAEQQQEQPQGFAAEPTHVMTEDDLPF